MRDLPEQGSDDERRGGREAEKGREGAERIGPPPVERAPVLGPKRLGQAEQHPQAIERGEACRGHEWRPRPETGEQPANRRAEDEPAAAPLIVASLLWQVAHEVYPATWSFWAVLKFGWTPAQIGWSLVAAGVAMGAAQVFITGPAVARFGEQRAIVVGMIVGGLAFAFYAVVPEGWMVYPIIAFSAFQGLVYPSLNALLSRMTDASNQGALQGGMAAVASIAAIVGPLAMTQVLAAGAEQGFEGSAFVAAAVLVLLALMVVWAGVLRRSAAPPPVE